MTSLTGTGALLRLVLRRDRILMPIWILTLGVMPLLVVLAFEELTPTAQDRDLMATLANTNPAFVAMFSWVYDSSLGGLVAWRSGPVPIILALVTLLTVIRHTRTEEEAGRKELLGSAPVGRQASLAAALIATCGASVMLASVTAGALIARGMPVDGSIALASSYVMVGWVFAGAGAVVAQLTESAGSARGIGIGALGAVFALRLGGDITGEALQPAWPSWLSPIGWSQQVRPFAGERWWVLALAVPAVAMLTAAAFWLSARRDVEAGLMRPRPGRASASAALRSPLALAARLHKGLIAGWMAGFAALGLMFGGIADSMRDLAAGNPELEQIIRQLGGDQVLIDAFIAAMMGMLALIASGYAIQAGLRMRAEETSQRAEPVLAASVSRVRWAGSHVVFALLGPALALGTAGVVMGVVHGIVTGDVARELPRMLSGAVVQLPAVWVLAGIAVAAFGLLPKYTAIAWGALGLFFFLGQLGSVLQLDQWALNLSPYTHVPALPGADLVATPLLSLAAVAGALTVTGLVAFRRRDIASA